MDIMNVSQVTGAIKRLFETDKRFISILVRGEISNFKQHSSGHCYFTLKDNLAVLRSVMFRANVLRLKFLPVNGLKVVASGRITVYERDGQYQLYVEQLLPEGLGELSLAFEQLKEKLGQEGLFDTEKKRPIPLLPQRVGIATSPTGAVLRDIISVGRRRNPNVQFLLYPVAVQGAEAPGQLVQAIQLLNTISDIDVIIVGRGGGSLEELWAFNNEAVVRAIAASRIPVVSAVGHQTDYTLADFAADCRAATPSQAAELVVPDLNDWNRRIFYLQSTLQTYLIATMKQARQKLETCLSSRVWYSPEYMLEDKYQTVDLLMQRLEQACQKNVVSKQHQLQVQTEKLSVLNPLAVLSRGFSIVQDETGRVIADSRELSTGQIINIRLQKGIVQAVVRNTKEASANG